MANNVVVGSLKKVAKGSVIVLIGAVFYYIARFLFRTILARGLSAEGYGIIALSITIVDTVALLSLLGFPAVLTRQIAVSRSRGEKPHFFATAGIFTVLFTSFVASLLVYLASDIISSTLNVPADVLRVFSASIFFTAILWVAVAVAQGYEDVSVLAYVQHILYGLLLLVSAVVAGLLFKNVLLAAFLYLFSAVVSSAIALTYLIYRKYLYLGIPSLSNVRSLLLLAAPIFASNVVSVVSGRMDTFMLGYFLGSAAVGIYNVALTVVNLLSFFLLVASYLYVPVASSFASLGDLRSLKRFYQIITKWIVVFTLPLFAIFVLYPQTAVSTIFGQEYAGAAVPLSVLALAHLVNTALGANGWTLIALGETRMIFFCTVLSATINFILNAVLIPDHGIFGAALATATSIIFTVLVSSAFLYGKYRVHPVTRQYLVPFLAAFIPLLIFKFLDFSVSGLFDMFFLLSACLLAYGVLLLVLRVFEKEDIEILRSIERRLGLNLEIVRSILRLFS